jgi:hypothetical protein
MRLRRRLLAAFEFYWSQLAIRLGSTAAIFFFLGIILGVLLHG